MGVEVGRAKGDVGLSLKLWDGGGGGVAWDLLLSS